MELGLYPTNGKSQHGTRKWNSIACAANPIFDGAA